MKGFFRKHNKMERESIENLLKIVQNYFEFVHSYLSNLKPSLEQSTNVEEIQLFIKQHNDKVLKSKSWNELSDIIFNTTLQMNLLMQS